ncbi:sulfotransferase, partial [bacterium]|nr:sulfotransferase [bacterium]
MSYLDNPIFIVGLPRSGSTLWLNIFAENPKIFRMGEMLFLTPWRKYFRYFIRRQVGDLSIVKNIKKMIELIFSREKISGIDSSFWNYDIEKVNHPNLRNKLLYKILESDKSLESIFKIMIEEITRFYGDSSCCVKFPVHVNHVPKLLQWFPNCKVVHITRDPRAMAISKTNDPGGTAKMIEKHPGSRFLIKKIMVFWVIVQYIWVSKLHCKYKHYENYALFKYEDLLAEPEKTIKELCE